MELPQAILDAAASRRISYADLGLLLAIVAHQDCGKLAGSIPELSALLGVNKGTLLAAMGRLHAAQFVNWRPSKTRYVQSYCEIIVPEIVMMNHPAKNQDDEAVTSGDSFDSEMLSTESTASVHRREGKGLRSKDLRPSASSTVRTKPTFEKDSTEFRMSLLLLQLIRTNLDPNRRADLNAWAVHIDRLIRLDGRTAEEVEAVILWLHNGNGNRDAEFWRSNVLSTKTLRDKFPTLIAKMPKAPRRSKPQGESCPECEGSGYIHLANEDAATACPTCKGKGLVVV